MSATYVYVITGHDGWPLYVGHTSNLFRRLREHSRSPWAKDVRKVTAEVFALKADALERERDYIADLEPTHNRQGWFEPTDADLIAWAAA